MTTLTAPSAALVAQIHVAPGDIVPAGAPLLTTELMKMSHVLRADGPCRVEAVLVAAGDALSEGQPLLTLAPADAAAPTAAIAQTDRPERATLTARLTQLEDAARPDAVAKRHAKGLRTARENLADLLDPGSFAEFGALAVAAQRTVRDAADLAARTPADGIVTGTGTVAGRPVAVLAVDYTVLAGTQGYFHHRKIDRMLEACAHLPLVLYAEGGGGRPGDLDVDPLIAAGLTVPSFARFTAHRPLKIGIAAGYCFAGNAALWGVCDIRIATEGSNIGMGGPAMIEGGGLGQVAPGAIGPSHVQAANGVIDLLVPDEAAATAAARGLLSLSTPAGSTADTAALREAVPADRTQAYDMRRFIGGLTDDFAELRSAAGPGVIAGIARIGAQATALIANNPLHLGGAIDGPAADKATWMLRLAARLGLPVLSLIDTPGFMVGPEAEDAGQVAHAAALFQAGAAFTGPWVALITRKAYGLGAMAMAGGSLDRPHMTLGWPTAELGAMGLEGAVRLGFRAQLEAIADPAERQAEYDRLLAQMYDRGSALNAASLLEFDAVTLPEDTPAALARAFAAAGG
ncbi:MAG: carboxyl transferase domain-containing protein [Pseudomonadota bacterium]